MEKPSPLAEREQVNNAVIEGFRRGDKNVIINVYRELCLPLSKYLSENKGKRSDVEDIAWISLEKFRIQCLKPDFKLISKNGKLPVHYLKYIMGIARHVWLRVLRYDMRLPLEPQGGDTDKIVQKLPADNRTEAELSYSELVLYIKGVISALPHNCQTLFEYYAFKSWKMKEIVKETNVAETPAAAHTQLYLCRRRLRQALRLKLRKEWQDINLIKRFIN